MQSGGQQAPFQQRYQAAVDHLRNGQLAQAHALYSRLLLEFPERCELHNDFGHLLRLTGEPLQAISHFRKALAIEPRYAAAAYNMAVAQAQVGEVSNAIGSYRHALSLNPNLAEAHNNLANLLRSRGDVEKAITHYRKALKIRPGFIDAAANLVVALENLHLLDEARMLAHQILKAVPTEPMAKLVLARLDLRKGHLDTARQRLQHLLDNELSSAHEVAVAAELGQVYDRMGRHEDAVKAVMHGKKVTRETQDPDRLYDDSFVRRIRKNQEWFTSERIRGWASEVPNAGPAPVFLVGFPRSGTTLTEQVLASHPAFVTSHEKPFLNNVLNDMDSIVGSRTVYPDGLSELSEEGVSRLREAYWTHVNDELGDEGADKRLVDKLPLNIVQLGFVRRIFPESLVIVVMRDPRDACLSGFFQALKLNPAMVAFLDLERTVEFYAAVMDLWLHYRSVLGLNWIEIRYEDLIQDFEAQARQLLDHLGESWNDEVLRFHESAAKRYSNTPSYRDVTSPIYTRAMGRWRNYEPLLAPVSGRLGKYVTELGYDA
jgi:tetratricopeptide (TPR) repeat protein